MTTSVKTLLVNKTGAAQTATVQGMNIPLAAYEVKLIATPAPVDTSAPTPPTNVTVTNIASTGLTLNWNPSTDNVAVTGYHVYRNSMLIGSPAGTAWVDTGLSSGTTYSYTVSAFDANSNVSANSAPMTATTLSSPPPSLKPGDVNGDGAINIFDASILSAHWLQSGQSRSNGDLNGDGVVNIFDAAIVSTNWGK